MWRGSDVDGGHTIATDLRAGSFIEMIRMKSIILQLGATYLTGLRGKVEIPRQTGSGSAQWIPETGTVEPSNAKFDKIALNMKTVAAKSFVSRNLMMQSSLNVESFVRAELVRILAEAIDRQLFTAQVKIMNLSALPITTVFTWSKAVKTEQI